MGIWKEMPYELRICKAANMERVMSCGRMHRHVPKMWRVMWICKEVAYVKRYSHDSLHYTFSKSHVIRAAHSFVWFICTESRHMQKSFCKRATNHRALLRKITSGGEDSWPGEGSLFLSQVVCWSHEAYVKSHVTHMNESCHTYECAARNGKRRWVTSGRHVPHLRLWCDSFTFAVSSCAFICVTWLTHIHMQLEEAYVNSHVKYECAAQRGEREWVTSNIWMRSSKRQL